ncbi:MAG: prepilin-type N-terminal cleavage/methylation domain-containing protein [Candidatus Portnoybacteria bacterium]|nr:prepilin-type N-terminal cleavage/methylation domain-containing protein [Candidatus Portnoybacteria bacterium]MDD4982891.1 prepilin-type N-terminal cleavage/methylation domain-containing protein [Candidatus Portnoybacteria bacterium]
MNKQKKGIAPSKSKGFTLIELLVVIAIIGLLATIVTVSLNTARAKARDVKRISDIGQFKVALQMYYDANGYYPVGQDGDALVLLTPVYINSLPKDPLNNLDFKYCVSASHGYHLGTNAPLEAANSALNSDADKAAADCAAGGFDGTDNVYDVIP